MALTESEPFVSGVPLPGFSLPDVISGNQVGPDDFAGAKALVIVFLCRHCPYVVHVLPPLIGIARDYLLKGVAFAGISSNDADTYPADAPDKLREMAEENDLPFPVLYDASQDTARAFHAACTPEFFVFDGARRLCYHGRMDGSTPGNNVPCTGEDLKAALDAILAGKPAPAPQHPSMGCNIKWK